MKMVMKTFHFNNIISAQAIVIVHSLIDTNYLGITISTPLQTFLKYNKTAHLFCKAAEKQSPGSPKSNILL